LVGGGGAPGFSGGELAPETQTSAVSSDKPQKKPVESSPSPVPPEEIAKEYELVRVDSKAFE
jgi:hypothetical protein